MRFNLGFRLVRRKTPEASTAPNENRSLGHKYVCGFNVAVDDTFGVGSIECIGDLNRQTEQDIGLDGLSCDAMLQRQAVQILHCNDRMVTVLADFVDVADVRMVQCRSSLSLSLKAGQCL